MHVDETSRTILALQGKVLSVLSEAPETAEEIASAAGAPDSAETVCLPLEHLAANGRAHANGGDSPGQMTFQGTLIPQEVIA
jgi:glucose-6-phosphate isomerase